MHEVSLIRTTRVIIRHSQVSGPMRAAGFLLMLVALALFSGTNLNAFPVYFEAHATAGTPVVCTTGMACDPLDLSGNVATGTYVSGITTSGGNLAGTTCVITFTGGGGTGATATVALSGVDTITSGAVLAITAHGSNYTSPPTTGTVSNGTATNCTGTPVLTTTLAAPSTFLLTGSFDTTDIPASSGVNCSAGLNCKTYNIPVTLIAPPAILSFPVSTTAPVTITVNTSPTPSTFFTTLQVPAFGGNIITINVTAGIPAGTITAPTPDGFGKAFFVPGSAPFTFGSVFSYVGSKNNNYTQLTFSGSLDAINVLHTFTGTATDGGFPHSTLTQTGLAPTGVATFEGATFGSPSLASTLFTVNNNPGSHDSQVRLHTFVPGTEGTSAGGSLMYHSNGYLYGVSVAGGSATTGTMFISAPGSTTVGVINPATGKPTFPRPASVIEGADLNVYGVTTSPTATNTFFKFNPSTGVFTTLYTFTAGDGIPSGPVIQASDGNFYGETSGSSFGKVYRLTPAGGPLVILHLFNGTDGENPTGGLMQASNGILYGVAGGGSGSGVVFNVNTAGTFFSTPHTFIGSDGAAPTGGLVQASDSAGNAYLFGTTSSGGANSLGTVFRLTLATNAFKVVHDFGGIDGQHPNLPAAALTVGSDGKLYGTAAASVNASGNPAGGTVFSLNPKLQKPKPQIVRFNPVSGPVGTQVTITGRNLLGLSSVTFGGVAATSIHSRGANYVIAQVPAGAVTGPIVVTTPNGVATSTTNFTVSP